MADANIETIRRLYAEVLAPGRLEDQATAQLVPELFDPEVEVRQMSALAGTAGEFHGYRGLMESNRENLQALTDLSFHAEEIRAVGDLVATVAVVRGTGRRSRTPFEARVGHLFTLRDGRVVRFQVFDDPADALNTVRR